MNKSGMVFFYLFMIGVVFFILGLALAPALNDVIKGDDVIGDNGLNCSSELISNQDKSICYQIDVIPPLFIGLVFGLGGILIAGGRLL